jgi:hypothetical protein
MGTIHLTQFEDSFVIHFGGEFARINAYTLASSLVNLADAAKAANTSINPGFEIEVIVEALGSGSFRARLRTIYKEAENLFSRESLRAIVLSVIATFIYENTLAPADDIIVNVGTNEVVVEHKDKRIVIPRAIHDAIEHVRKSPQFLKGVSQTMRTVEADPSITSIGFSRTLEGPPEINIPRDRFAALPIILDAPSDGGRELEEITDVEILRAILERSRRRWEFVWNGMTISAPVTDKKFYDDFFAHRIMIAPGDALRVRLRIRQQRAPGLGIFVNESYEITEVINHIPRSGQTHMKFDR